MQLIPSKDSSIREANPDTNYGSYTDIEIKSKINDNIRCYIGFDITNAPSTINIAKLFLYNHYIYPALNIRTINVNRVTSSWVESSITWNTIPSITATNSTTFNTVGSAQWLSVDITNMINDETSNVFSVRLIDSVEGASSSRQNLFYSREGSTPSYLELNGYYVKTDGDDTKTGTSWVNAWKTINKVATTVADGSTVHIGFGTYDAEPASNKIAPQNVGASGITYLPETATTGGGTGTVSVEQNT